MWKFLKFIIITILILIFTTTLSLGIVFLLPSKVKFDEEKLLNSNNLIEIYDKNNQEIECSNLSNSKISISELNDYTKNAFIAIEDKNFYTHKGIEIKRIISAIYKNLTSFSYKQGASTISQQLIKNTHLTNKKTLSRKIDEIKLSVQLEKNFSKDKILEMYLNTIYFGENAYGLEQASKTYFNKSAKDLNINESALLAGIIVAPSKLNPKTNFNGAIERKNLVLTKMNEQNYLNSKNVNLLKNEEIKLDFNDNYATDKSFIQSVMKEFNQLKEDKPYTFTNCKIYTNFSKDTQASLINNKPSTTTDYQAIVLDNSNSSVIAYYSTCGEISRCPASTVKPWLVYAPCINEKLISPLTQIIDEKTDFSGYSPSNYGDKYYGKVSCQDALIKSLNIPSVKLMQCLGVEKAKNYAKQLDVEIPASGLGISLGALDKDITLKKIAGAYSTFANLGYYKKPYFITKITNSNGDIIYKRKDESKKVFNQSTTSLINKMLSETVKDGTGKALRSLPYEICVKTGTNGNDKGNLDAYSIGYTKNNTFCVWLGNKDNKLMDNSIKGSTQPSQCLREIINDKYKTKKPDKIEEKDIVKLKINKDYYEKYGEIKLHNSNDNNFIYSYFDVNNQPTTYAESENLVKINEYSIELNNNLVKINFDTDDLVFVEVRKKYDNSERIVFNGKYFYQEILPKNLNFNYVLVPYIMKNNEKVYGNEIVLQKISINNKNIPITPENWWEQ